VNSASLRCSEILSQLQRAPGTVDRHDPGIDFLVGGVGGGMAGTALL